MTGRIAKRIASGIGLAREGAAHHRESKEAEQQNLDVPQDGPPRSRSQSTASSIVSEEDYDNELWVLDDVEQQEAPSTNPFLNVDNEEDLIKAFGHLHPPPYSESGTQGKLTMPVMLPQRRPRHETRGFVRAYAPMLEDVGIDQKTWLDFLSGFDEAIRLHQAFNAIQLVVRGTDLAIQIAAGPNIFAHLASWVIHASVEASRRGYVQYRTNKYLDDMNTHFFRPHNLYALIMCYRPTTSNDPNAKPSDTLTAAVSHRVDGNGGKMSRSSGKTTSELALPASAPLIFPKLDAVPEDKKPNSAKRAGAFLSEYADRRAQATFEHNNPSSKLRVDAPRKEFVSRYSDPNSAATNGGLIGLVSGGNVTGPRYRRQQRRRRQKLERDGQVVGRRRLVVEDVYYLMVINMPTDEEIEENKRIVVRDEAGR